VGESGIVVDVVEGERGVFVGGWGVVAGEEAVFQGGEGGLRGRGVVVSRRGVVLGG